MMNEDADVSLFVRIYIHVYVWVYTYVYVDIRVCTFPMQKILLHFSAKSGCQIDVCGYYFAFFIYLYCFFFLIFSQLKNRSRSIVTATIFTSYNRVEVSIFCM